MANVTSTYIVAGGSNSFLAAEYLVRRIGEEAVQAANIAPVVWYQELVDTVTMVAHFRVLNGMSVASSATEAAALPSASWSPTGTTVTCGLDGFSVVESKVVNSISPDVLDKIAFQAGTALARTADTSLAALFSSLTAGAVGTSGSALTLANMLLADANLDAAFAIGKRYGFVHPHNFYDIKNDIVGKNFGISRVTVDAQGNEMVVAGSIEVRKNALVAGDSSGADWYGGVITEEALGLAVAQRPSVEILPIPQQHAYAIDATYAFGTGVIRPTFGCLVIGSKSA